MNDFQVEMLRKAEADDLPDQLGEDYTLDQLAQCAELVDAGLLSGDPIPNEEGRICSIIHPSITLEGREALESLHTAGSGEQSKTRVERTMKRLHDNPWIAPVIIIALVLIGIGAVFASLDNIIGFWQKHILHSDGIHTDPNPIRYMSHTIEKSDHEFKARIHFRRENEDVPWGRHSFQAVLPEQSNYRILEFRGATGGQYFESSITNDAKYAEATYTPHLEAALSLKLSGPETVTISGNHGLKTFRIEVK